MPESDSTLAEFLDKVPKPDEIKRRITENLRKGKLLRQLLRLAEQRQAVEEVSSCR
jgi:hypothetical protein